MSLHLLVFSLYRPILGLLGPQIGLCKAICSRRGLFLGATLVTTANTNIKPLRGLKLLLVVVTVVTTCTAPSNFYKQAPSGLIVIITRGTTNRY